MIEEITGAETIDIVGLCLGGAMTAITAAYLTQEGDSRVGTLTLLNTMLDYAQPGALGAFTDIKTVERLERKMRKAGALEGETMAGTFDILRANDLIFNYVVSNWLMGQPPPAFDILAWNADSTRMPAAMHAFYLRNFYVREQAGRRRARDRRRHGSTCRVIKSPTYVVSAINDHIVLWESAYKTVGLVSGPVRFVLGSGGHIAGIVSPPGPKAWHHGQRQRLRCRRPARSGGRSRSAGRAPGGRTGPVWSDGQLRAAVGPAADGQRHIPGARRRAGDLRQGLTTAAGSRRPGRHGRPGVSRASGAGRRPARPAPAQRACRPGVAGSSRDRLREAMARAAMMGWISWPRSWTASSMAATTSPPGPKTGMATPQTPASSSQRVTATRVSRVTAEGAAEPVGRGDGVGGVGA